VSRLMPSRFPIRAASPFRPPVRHGLVVGDGAPNVAGASQDSWRCSLALPSRVNQTARAGAEADEPSRKTLVYLAAELAGSNAANHRKA
jgi:hypothetical protein